MTREELALAAMHGALTEGAVLPILVDEDDSFWLTMG
jgi:hypothetical protein